MSSWPCCHAAAWWLDASRKYGNFLVGPGATMVGYSLISGNAGAFHQPYHDAAKLDEAAAEIAKETGATVDTLVCDLASLASVRTATDEEMTRLETHRHGADRDEEPAR